MTIALILAALVTGADIVDENLDGKSVVVEGRAIGFTESGFAMKVDEIPVTVHVDDIPYYLNACSVTHPRVRVTGILEQVYGTTASGQAEGVVGLRLRPAAQGGLVFIPDPIFFFNPFTLTILVALLVGYVFKASRRQLRTRTLMAERKRMADDLHDTIEQHLVGAGMLLQLGRTAEAREILVRAKKEMRDIVWGLKNDDMMRQSPAEMVRQYAKEETKKGVCRVETRLSGLPERLDVAEMRDLSLVIRESVGNAVKHGHAGKVAIAADSLPDGGWQLRISNDGTPFDAATALGPSEGHFGVEGMKARARRFGAELTIGAEGGRTVVSVVRRGSR